VTAELVFAGDTHGSLDHLKQVPADKLIIHLGDFDLEEPLESALPDSCHDRLWWIPGNHDYDKEYYYDRLFGSVLAERSLHTRVVEVSSVRVAGLGGVFKGKIWWPPEPPVRATVQEYMRHLPRQNKWRGGLPLKVRSAIWKEDWEALSSQRADVLVTHEAPESHENGFRALGDLARAMGAHTIVHGHHHVDYVAEIEGGVRVIGVGLRSVADMDGRVLVSTQRGE
jgi:predicted phosphodiesterase